MIRLAMFGFMFGYGGGVKPIVPLNWPKVKHSFPPY
jgi:hypothetical protein